MCGCVLQKNIVMNYFLFLIYNINQKITKFYIKEVKKKKIFSFNV